MKSVKWSLLGAACVSVSATAQQGAPVEATQIVQSAVVDLASAPTEATLPAGTAVLVTLDKEISSKESKLGDGFAVTVQNDVMQDGVVVIPKGTKGQGELTFVSKKGAFGKSGMIGIALRHLDLNGKQYFLDGRYREEGGHNAGGAATAMFAVGILGAAVVTGKTSIIPQGRELKARTGEDIKFPLISAPVPSPAPAVPPPATAPVPPAQSAGNP